MCQVYGLAVCAIMSSGLLDAEGITAVSVHAHETVLEDSGIGQDAKELSAFASTSAMSTDASCARAFKYVCPPVPSSPHPPHPPLIPSFS